MQMRLYCLFKLGTLHLDFKSFTLIIVYTSYQANQIANIY